MGRCAYYVDLKIHPRFFQSQGGHRPPVVEWMAHVLSILHGAFAARGSAMPLAFPDYLVSQTRQFGRCVRVFAESQEEAERLVLSIYSQEWLQENVQLSPVCPVPAKISHWAVFSRMRWPHRRRSPEKYRELCERFERLPSVRLVSRSSGNPFVLAVSKTSAATPSEPGQLDGYGLSHTTKPVVVPCFDAPRAGVHP